jgi:DNA modification methylase
MTIRFVRGDCREVLARLPPDSVHCVVTSPPYWGLRDYGVAGQLGLEPTIGEYVANMVEVFRAVRRVLRKDGVMFLNLGDSYLWRDAPYGTSGKAKDLCGIPWRVAFALQEDGWWLRQDIIWAKPNPMPESVTDRCTKAHEYLFLLTKSARYFYDAEAIKEPTLSLDPDHPSYRRNWVGRIEFSGKYEKSARTCYPSGRNKRSVWIVATSPFSEAHFATFPPKLIEPCIKAGTSERGCCAKCGAPWKRKTKHGRVLSTGGSATGARASNLARVSVLGQKVNSAFNTGAFVQRAKITTGWRPTCKCAAAVVPATVLDPFGGAGTTGLVADRLHRDAVLIELGAKYVAMARRRIAADRKPKVTARRNVHNPRRHAAPPQLRIAACRRRA